MAKPMFDACTVLLADLVVVLMGRRFEWPVTPPSSPTASAEPLPRTAAQDRLMRNPTIDRAVVVTTFETRLLPTTKSVPTDLLPLAGVPVAQRLLTTLTAVGVIDVMLTGFACSAVAAHFDRDAALEHRLAGNDERQALVELRRAATRAVISTVHAVGSGTGDGVAAARHHLGTDPFIVARAASFRFDDAQLLDRLVAIHARTGLSAVALPDGVDRRVALGDQLERAGRYVLTEEAFAALDATMPRLGEGRRLGDALTLLNRHGRLAIVPVDEESLDLGDPVERLRIEIELMLADPVRGAAVAEVLVGARRHAAQIVA
jgi:UTP--glucose-1-phosphate uridylyltransferase